MDKIIILITFIPAAVLGILLKTKRYLVALEDIEKNLK